MYPKVSFRELQDWPGRIVFAKKLLLTGTWIFLVISHNGHGACSSQSRSFSLYGPWDFPLIVFEPFARAERIETA